MKRWSGPRLVGVCAASGIVWLVVAAVCLCFGSTGSVGWPDHFVLPERIASVRAASLIGAALGLAGAAYQAVLRNPLADPYLLGVSSGASLATFAWGLCGAAGFGLLQLLAEPAVAFAGAMGALGDRAAAGPAARKAGSAAAADGRGDRQRGLRVGLSAHGSPGTAV